METLIKRFLQETPLHALGSLAFLAGSISIELLFLHPVIQFILSSLIVSSFAAIFFLIFATKSVYSKYLTSVSILAGLVFNVFSGLSALFAVSLLFTLSLPLIRINLLYYSAITAHIADVLSTYILLPNLSEANNVVRILIQAFGVAEGLIISKVLLIIFPLTYSYFELDDDSQVFFVKIVFILGTSMAFRNTLIMFSLSPIG